MCDYWYFQRHYRSGVCFHYDKANQEIMTCADNQKIFIDSNIYTLHSVITIWPTYDEIIICFSVQEHQNNTGSKRPKNALTSQNLAENDQSVLFLELWYLTHDNRPSRDKRLKIHS